MNTCCKYILSILFLALMLGGEAILYSKTDNVKTWMITLMGVINYLVAYCSFALIHEFDDNTNNTFTLDPDSEITSF